jgi:enediyne biosynthesis protein E4
VTRPLGLGIRTLFALWLAPASAFAAESGVPRFTDQTEAAGIRYRNVCGAVGPAKGWLTESMGAGAAWLDYDGDGVLDLYLVNGSTHDRPAGKGEPNRLYRGLGRGRFSDVTEKAGVGDRGWGYGVAVGDYDNDSDPDLFVTNLGPDVLYRNNGDGTFSDVSAAAGISRADAWGSSAAFFDMDNDGDLDLYVAQYMEGDPKKVARRGTPEAQSVYCTFKSMAVFCGPLGQPPLQDVLYRNDGKGKFTDVTREAGIWLDRPRYGLGVVTGDYDNDGDTDVFVADDSVANTLWNNKGGRFTDVALPALVAWNGDGRPQAGMGTDMGDWNGDGFLDIVVTTFSHDTKTLFRNAGGRYFVDESNMVGLGVTQMALSWGTGFYDFDRDGSLDLFIANGHVYPGVDDYKLGTTYKQTNYLFLNRKNKLVEVSSAAGPGFAVARSFRGAAFADYDDDGDIDVVLTAIDEPALLLRNDGPSAGHWLGVRLEGVRSNRDGVGARVTVTADGRSQLRERKGGGSYLSASDGRLHFGLGPATKVERLAVRWPSGVTDQLSDVAADRTITIREGTGKAR